MPDSQITFVDLKSQKKMLGDRIERAMQAIHDHGCYIMGPEVFELEKELSKFCGAKHSISCSSGTDALALILMAKGIGLGDAVLLPTFTFAATAEVVVALGATPLFVDILPGTFNLDPVSLEKGIQAARNLALKPKTVISVDLFGQAADYDAIEAICQKNDLWLLSDAAQSFGARYKGRKVGTIGLATATSFYPAKPLGCYGDGGAIFTDDDELADLIKSLRVHGQGLDKYDNVRIGMNGRLDTIQAAILLQKLSLFSEEILKRNQIAARYSKAFKDIFEVPLIQPDLQSVWAQYTVKIPHGKRDHWAEALRLAGIPTAIYYPKSLHQQKAFHRFPTAGKLKVSEDLAMQVLSLPMHAYISEQSQEFIIHKVREIFEAHKVQDCIV